MFLDVSFFFSRMLAYMNSRLTAYNLSFSSVTRSLPLRWWMKFYAKCLLHHKLCIRSYASIRQAYAHMMYGIVYSKSADGIVLFVICLSASYIRLCELKINTYRNAGTRRAFDVNGAHHWAHNQRWSSFAADTRSEVREKHRTVDSKTKMEGTLKVWPILSHLHKHARVRVLYSHYSVMVTTWPIAPLRPCVQART